MGEEDLLTEDLSMESTDSVECAIFSAAVKLLEKL